MGFPNLKVVEIIFRSLVSKRNLERKPEPFAVTDQERSVQDYNRVMETNLTANYAVGLDLIHRSGIETNGMCGLDLCSGPGFFALCLAKYLNFKNIKGIDLSYPMVNKANDNSNKWGLSTRVQFHLENILNISDDSQYDLVTFTNSAHHMPNIRVVSEILQKAETLTKESGLILLTDLARLKTTTITEKFVKHFGREFIDKDMPAMFEDFNNSMYAAFSPEELAETIPAKSNRTWIHVIPKGLTCFQALVGLPVGQTDLLQRESGPWETCGIHQSLEALEDWRVLKGVVEQALHDTYHPNRSIKTAA